MADLRLRHRARMREKDAARLSESLAAAFGIPDPLPATVERADAGDFDVLVANGRILAFVRRDPERIAPTCRLLLLKRPAKAFVTVDMGAVKFVNNGADVMAPGIVEADPGIQPGDLVWIRDEKNKVPLAVGEAILPGAQMPRGPKGKAVKSLHHVGDPMWELEL
ncbi:MAG TPA: RNA-binding protein [Candidatus Thermoplasmatota archaeon]|nr:RNA-binding protein [Candidatus Thermoplasmatota archaeon]